MKTNVLTLIFACLMLRSLSLHAAPTTPVNNAMLTGNAVVPSGATLTIRSGGSIIAESGSTVTGFGGGGGGGNVSSVGLSMPTGFSVANSPITSSGTLNVTYSGGIPNSAFANSTITLGNTTLTLGGTTTNLSGVDVQTNTGKFLISGNGRLPLSTELGWGTNGLGNRVVFNTPSGGELNFNVAGTTTFYVTGSSVGTLLSTASTSTTTGAAIITGGVGVGGNVNVGGNIASAGTMTPQVATTVTTGSAGQFAFDSNAWTTGRGAIQINDGTASTYVVSVLASDTPTNGQVPTWNTGGTITWETPATGNGTGNVTGSSLTGNAIIVGNGTNSVGALASLGTSGQPLISAGAGAPPAFGTLGVTGGGVGITSTAKGNIIIGNNTTTMGQLTVGADNRVLTANSSATLGVSWEVVGSGNVTNNASLTANAVVLGNGTTGIGPSTITYTSANSTYTFGTTGSANIIANVVTLQNLTVTDMSVTNLTLTNPITANVGGVGFTSTTKGNLIIGNNTTTYGQLGVGTDNKVLTANSSATYGVSWETPAGGGNVTNNATLASGNIVIGGGTSVVGTTNITVSGNAVVFPGNVTVSGTVVNPQIGFSGALGTDDTYSGLTITGLTAGATIAQWEAVYLDGSSTWQLADANGSGTYPAVGLAVAAYSSTNPAVVVYSGTVRNDAWNWTPGGVVYLSTTAGGLTQTAPSTSGDKVQQIGRALTADILLVNINNEYLTVQ